jgi:predicted transposase YdaD
LGSSLTPAEREAYDRIRDAIMTTRTLFEGKYNDMREEGYKDGFEEGFEDGKEKGFEEGKEKGREKGHEEGRQEGRDEGERKKALEVAGTMKAKGFDANTIAEVTGLAVEDILRL